MFRLQQECFVTVSLDSKVKKYFRKSAYSRVRRGIFWGCKRAWNNVKHLDPFLPRQRSLHLSLHSNFPLVGCSSPLHFTSWYRVSSLCLVVCELLSIIAVVTVVITHCLKIKKWQQRRFLSLLITPTKSQGTQELLTKNTAWRPIWVFYTEKRLLQLRSVDFQKTFQILPSLKY